MLDNEIVISVACYRNDDEIIEFAKQLLSQKNHEHITLLVTCNAVNDFDKLKERLNGVGQRYMAFNPQKNLGYLHGCLYGLEAAKINYGWALITNTDITFCSDDFFERLLNIDTDGVWAVGPDVTLKSTNKRQNPFMVNRPSSSWLRTRRIAFSNVLFYRLFRSLSKLKNKGSHNEAVCNSGKVYSIHGSCMLLKKQCVDAVICNNDPIFMYEEELLVSELCLENGKSVYFNGEASIIHNENQTTGKIGLKRRQGWIKSSLKYICKRFDFRT